MRDFPETTAPETQAEPRGRAALGLSPKGMFHDWVITPMKGRAVTLAAKATTGVVLVVAVYALLA